MSHIVQIQTEVRHPAAIEAACRRLGLPAPSEGIVQLYSAQAHGWRVQLPGWRYPIVFDTASGQIQLDDFNGHWGDRVELDHFLQAYAVELAKLEARRRGHSVTEQPLADGSIKLTIEVGGGL